MLTILKVYSSWESVDQLLLDTNGLTESDLFQIQDITGLGPVAAAVNTTSLGSFDGDSYVGSSVGKRNIVLNIKPNPNWVDWTYEKLRNLLYTYFMPKLQVQLVFETDDFAPVEIIGYVESVEPSIFSKDGQIQISIVCPYPYFTAVTPTVITGVSNNTALSLNYDGTIETAINLKVAYTSGANPTRINIQVGNSAFSFFEILTSIDTTKYLVINSVSGQKYVQTVTSNTGVITNLLSNISSGSTWPTLKLGINNFSVLSNAGVQDWTLTYYKRYGGL